MTDGVGEPLGAPLPRSPQGDEMGLGGRRWVRGAWRNAAVLGRCPRLRLGRPSGPKDVARRQLFFGYDRIVKAVMCQTFVAFEARVTKRCILVTAERKNCLVHALSIEDF